MFVLRQAAKATTSQYLKNQLKTRNFSRTLPTFNKQKDEDFIEAPPPTAPHPFTRAVNILSHDFKGMVDPTLPPLLEFSSHVDIVIIGGGVMAIITGTMIFAEKGSSIAYWIKQRIPRAGLSIMVIEKDPAYTRCSTVLSAGGLRQQFSLRENIEMSMFGAEFLRELPQRLRVDDLDAPDVQFNPQGYLLMATEEGASQLQENYLLQKELGAKVELLNRSRLKEKFPWINCDDIELATHGIENEGWFDPWALLFAFKQKAMHMGVEYVKGDVVGFEFNDSTRIVAGMEGHEGHLDIDKVIVKNERGELKTVKFANCIIAGGHESGNIAEMARIGRGEGILSVPLPVEPRKRYVYCFHAPDGPGVDCPLLIDTTGAYFRREGFAGHYIGGQSPPLSDEPNPETLDVDYTYFDNVVWPNLANRVPSLQNLKMKSAWAGYYDYNSFDQNAIIGHHPYYPSLLFATGFSGHGIQQAPAVGRAIMELILDGGFVTIDLSRFGFDRLVVGQEIRERNIF